MFPTPVSCMFAKHLSALTPRNFTVQHWHVYRRWNRCLFQELYKAYKEGRMAKDPSENWYKGELGFFGKFDDDDPLSSILVLYMPRQIFISFHWQRN